VEADAQGSPLKGALMRGLALGASMCSHPGCTTLRGAAEAPLLVHTCAACGGAVGYCSARCMQEDVGSGRHEAMCAALQGMAATQPGSASTAR